MFDPPVQPLMHAGQAARDAMREPIVEDKNFILSQNRATQSARGLYRGWSRAGAWLGAPGRAFGFGGDMVRLDGVVGVGRLADCIVSVWMHA